MVRICDDKGCSDRPRNSASFDATRDTNPEQTRRIAALSELGNKDPRAAYDLGLRYFRGDGVPQNSYQALQWMRSAGERGHPQAQLALGRFYLMGLEEMGSDPAEAEKWLSLAAGRGNKEATKLLAEASAAKKKNQADYKAWVDLNRTAWYGYWQTGYTYYWDWRPTGWYYRY
ncbi:Sel1 repeat-containing protein [Pseudorhodoferax soli]|uniref:Sel1 repeat-containing protein n=2 Tax=Pseudorhodoferax soli TaxID=545864 RepID=A0A368XFN3_9BURK|nr:Sel1 repeat-containing protein [Pseudorhodoferax soli]